MSKGKFIWYDLMTTDTAAAKEFYGKITGWGTQGWESDAEYTMWTVGETPIGGLMELPKEASDAGAPPHWLSYIQTDNVDDTVSQAEELSGSILKSAMDIPTVGRFAVLADPQGAAFSVFTPDEPMPPKGESPGLGEFSWHELATTDWEAGFGFYSTLFGWVKVHAMDMGEGGIYQMYGQADSAPLGGMYSKSAEMPGPPAWLYYVVVEDTHKTCELLLTLGATVLNGPMEVPGGSGDHIAPCMDPQGAAFAIHSRAKQQ